MPSMKKVIPLEAQVERNIESTARLAESTDFFFFFLGREAGWSRFLWIDSSLKGVGLPMLLMLIRDWSV